MVFDRVVEVFQETLNTNPEIITMEALLDDDLGVDSLDAVEVAINIENEFMIEIMDEKLEGLKTVGDLVKLIEDLVE